MHERERQLVEALAEMREEEAVTLARAMLEGGANPMRVLELCREGMEIVGKRFEKGEYFLPELILGGEMLEAIGALAKPLINRAPGGSVKSHGRVLIGTVQGD